MRPACFHLKLVANAFAGFGGQTLRRQMFVPLVLGVLLRRRAQEFDLAAVAPTPLARQQVKAQTKTLAKGQPPVERFRLQADRLLAMGRKFGDSPEEALLHVGEPIHWIVCRPAPASEAV